MKCKVQEINQHKEIQTEWSKKIEKESTQGQNKSKMLEELTANKKLENRKDRIELFADALNKRQKENQGLTK